MDFEQVFRDHLSSWITEMGPEGDVVLSSRVRLARNLRGIKFTTLASNEDLEQVLSLTEQAVGKIGQDLVMHRLAQVDELTRQEMVEKHLISPEHARNPQKKGVVINPAENISIMLNEEDHLRIQVIKAGLSLDKALDEANQIDDALDAHLSYAFSSKRGYLTSCPTNVGTGMRASVMLHLPGLVAIGQIGQVSATCSKLGLVIRGLYGEGSKSSGDIFQVSNQITLGYSEEDILGHLYSVSEQIISEERKARRILAENKGADLEDEVSRAYGILAFARKMDSDEAMELLSRVKLGIDLGMINGLDPIILKELMVVIRPAVLQKIMGSSLNPVERDIKRSAIIREKISQSKK